MRTKNARRALTMFGVAALTASMLTACASAAPPGGAAATDVVTAGGAATTAVGASVPAEAAVEGAEQASDADTDGPAGALAILAGTGRYTIGIEAPLGSYELDGSPEPLPAGCSWAILDADGQTYAARDDAYVFLTDIQEAVTFVTTGCPDWKQYE